MKRFVFWLGIIAIAVGGFETAQNFLQFLAARHAAGPAYRTSTDCNEWWSPTSSFFDFMRIKWQRPDPARRFLYQTFDPDKKFVSAVSAVDSVMFINGGTIYPEGGFAFDTTGRFLSDDSKFGLLIRNQPDGDIFNSIALSGRPDSKLAEISEVGETFKLIIFSHGAPTPITGGVANLEADSPVRKALGIFCNSLRPRSEFLSGLLAEVRKECPLVSSDSGADFGPMCRQLGIRSP